MVADISTTDILVKMYGAFGRWGMAAGKMEVLLVVSGLDIDRSKKVQLVNNYVNIKEGDMGGGDGHENQTGQCDIY